MSDVQTVSATSGRDRFDAAAKLFSRYDDLDDAELAALKRWYFKEASAFDVASMASREDLRRGYQAFREDHVDKFTLGDIVKGILFAFSIAAVAYTLVASGL